MTVVEHLLKVISKEETGVMPKNDSNSDSNTDKIRERDRERTETGDHDSRGRDSGYDGRVQDSDRDREREKDLEREREKERRHSGNDEGSVNIIAHTHLVDEIDMRRIGIDIIHMNEH
ncbi:unnamed protein product [Musa acuminata subsp. burmannicoides]